MNWLSREKQPIELKALGKLAIIIEECIELPQIIKGKLHNHNI